jgi:hypothetical protein
MVGLRVVGKCHQALSLSSPPATGLCCSVPYKDSLCLPRLKMAGLCLSSQGRDQVGEGKGIKGWGHAQG